MVAGSLAAPLLPEIDFGTDRLPDLHDRLAALREYGAVVPVRYLVAPAWLVLGHAEASAASHDDVHFDAATAYAQHSVPAMGMILQALSGEAHSRERSLVSAPFSPAAVRRLIESLIDPVIDELLDRLAKAGRDDAPVDFVAHFASILPFTVISRMLGIPVRDENDFLDWAVKLLDYPWDREGALAAKANFDAYFAPILAERRTRPREDFISTILETEIDGACPSDEQIMALLRLLVPAGSDTTWKALGSLFGAVLADPELTKAARHGDRERAGVVSESLRRDAPVALLPRACSRGTVLGGVAIEAFDKVLIGITAANNDPAVFPEPRRFDPTRNTMRMLSFGGGRHFCLGTHLARREMESALFRVLDRFPNIRLQADRAVEIVGTVLRGPSELWVRLG